jgi:hypothetical protein
METPAATARLWVHWRMLACATVIAFDLLEGGLPGSREPVRRSSRPVACAHRSTSAHSQTGDLDCMIAGSGRHDARLTPSPNGGLWIAKPIRDFPQPDGVSKPRYVEKYGFRPGAGSLWEDSARRVDSYVAGRYG